MEIVTCTSLEVKDLHHPITKEPDSIPNDYLFLLLICISKMHYYLIIPTPD